jgi:hypothetical protein
MTGLYDVLSEVLLDLGDDPHFAADLASDLLDRKGEEMFVRAVYHKARRRGVRVAREQRRRDLVINDEGIEVKVFSPWTVMRASNGGTDRSFDDFIHSKDLNALKTGEAQWLAAVVPHPLDRAHRQYPTRSHPGIIAADELTGRITSEAKAWAERNGVALWHRLQLTLTDIVVGSDNGRVLVEVYLFHA